MGKTKTAVISGTDESQLTGAEKYKLKQQKKKEAEAQNKAQVKGVGLKGGERVKVVGGDDIPVESEAEETTARRRGPKVRGKKYSEAKSKVDRNKLYPATEAMKLACETSISKFDGSVEAHFVIKKVGFSTQVNLPHGTGKAKRIEVADAKTIKKLKDGKIDFDVLLATADMMPKLVPYAKLLGPKGLMPNPKKGTLIKSKADAKKFGGNSVEIKTERKAPVIHIVVGKVSSKQKELIENFEALVKVIDRKQIVKCYLASTMGPSVKVEIN